MRKILFILFLCVTRADVLAEDIAQEVMNPGERGLGIVDELVSFSFHPEQVFLLREETLGVVNERRGNAFLVSAGSGEGAILKQTILIAPILLSNARVQRGNFLSSFLVFDGDFSFRATTVQSWSKEKILETTSSGFVLQEKSEEFERNLRLQKLEFEELQKELEGVRSQASQIAGVDEVLRLKAELKRLEGFGEETVEELERLRSLVEFGRAALGQEQTSSDGINALRGELAEHLKIAAEVTASADRLNRQRRDVAIGRVKQKLALIEETESFDRKALAQEVLRLRAERRRLEHRLNTTSASENPSESDEF